MRKFLFSALIIGGSMAIAQQTNQVIEMDYMDTSVRPQDDFYNYVNGNWMKTAEIPADRSRWGSFDQLRENTDLIVLSILEELLENEYPVGSDEQKISDLYKSYVDFSARDKAGLEPIHPYLDRIDAIENLEQLQAYLTDVTPIGLNPFYGFFVSSHMKDSGRNAIYLGGSKLGLGRDYYQKESESNTETLGKYNEYIDRIYAFTGERTRDFKGPAILGLEKDMASHMLPVEKLRDSELRYNPYAVKDLSQLSKNVDLKKFLNDLNVNEDSVIIGEIAYFQNLDQIINEENLPTLKKYMKFHLIDGSANFLTKELNEMNFDFYSRQLRGQEEQRPLEKRGLQFVNGTAGELLGKIYVKDNFPPEAKESATEMVDYLFQSYQKHINDLAWMSPETKKKALEKLSKFTVKIGYPDKWRDYSTMEVVSSDQDRALFQNVMNARKWSYDYRFNKIGKPVDRTEWGMTPQTVNAYFRASNNEIVFPAAIMQPPFYDYHADAAVNFGGMGAVIGHEISHSFDDSGAKYDGEGNLNNWWTEEDSKKFKEVGKALADQYSQYEPVPGHFVNGQFTLGENIGDLGGLNVAYDGLMLYLKDHGNPGKIDGFTPEQRFFISWATIWRTKYREEALKNQLKTDPHSPGYYRAIGPLENIDGFYQAFGVKEGDKMFKPKEERIIIW